MPKLCQWMSDHFNVLRAMRGTTRGWHTSDCRQVYIAIVRRMHEYAAAAWAPWLSANSTSKLEKVQLEAARTITNLVRSTQVEAVLAESQLPPISTCFQPISLRKAEEWSHLPPADDSRQSTFAACRQRLKRKDGRNTKFIRLNQLGLSSQVLISNSPLL